MVERQSEAAEGTIERVKTRKMVFRATGSHFDHSGVIFSSFFLFSWHSVACRMNVFNSHLMFQNAEIAVQCHDSVSVHVLTVMINAAPQTAIPSL